MLNQTDKNWVVKNIEIDNSVYRLYNEENVGSEFTLYVESCFKIRKLIKKYNFEVYHLKTSPKTTLKLSLNSDNRPDPNNSDVKKIKFYQRNDVYFLYSNLYFEVIYLIPHVSDKKYYSYEILVLVEQNFDINKIKNHNFNLINIESCTKLTENKINFNFIKSFFESRSILNNSTLVSGEVEYKIPKIRVSDEEFIKNYNNGNSNFNSNSKLCVESFIHVKNFNQNLYVQTYFKCLSVQIWEFGKRYYIEKNKYGTSAVFDDLYNSTGTFFTNFGELVNAKTVDNSKNLIEFNDLEHYGCCLSDNYYDLDIHSNCLSKEFVTEDFINFENKETRFGNEICSSCITDIILDDPYSISIEDIFKN